MFLSSTARVAELIVVVVPLTVRFPVTVRSLSKVVLPATPPLRVTLPEKVLAPDTLCSVARVM